MRENNQIIKPGDNDGLRSTQIELLNICNVLQYFVD